MTIWKLDFGGSSPLPSLFDMDGCFFPLDIRGGLVRASVSRYVIDTCQERGSLQCHYRSIPSGTNVNWTFLGTAETPIPFSRSTLLAVRPFRGPLFSRPSLLFLAPSLRSQCPNQCSQKRTQHAERAMGNGSSCHYHGLSSVVSSADYPYCPHSARSRLDPAIPSRPDLTIPSRSARHFENPLPSPRRSII